MAGGSDSSRSEFVAVDWGSTRLRLRLLSDPLPGAGVGGPIEPLAEISFPLGIGALEPGDHERVLLGSLEKLLETAGRRESWRASGGEVYFAGMVTSSIGWFPTPYVPVPAGPVEILRERRAEEIGGCILHFFPGVRTADDVMRGEEMEAIGILGGSEAEGRGGAAGRTEGESILVLPGTHSKWIRWADGRIADFITVPTGDLHAALHRASLLARTLPREPADVTGALLSEFDRGIDLARRDGPLASIFKARSLPVLSGSSSEAASALLSGILIGGEVLERIRGAPPARVLVAGSAALRGLYLRAFRRLSILAEEVPQDLAERASVEGLRRLRRLALGSGLR